MPSPAESRRLLKDALHLLVKRLVSEIGVLISLTSRAYLISRSRRRETDHQRRHAEGRYFRTSSTAKAMGSIIANDQWVRYFWSYRAELTVASRLVGVFSAYFTNWTAN